MVIIGLGANLTHPEYGEPVNTLAAALIEIGEFCHITKQSSWYYSAPVPVSDQPWFVNAVVAGQTDHSLEEFIRALHDVERKFGRIRRMKWEPRLIDLDLLSYDDIVTENRSQEAGPVVPHPRISERAFVLAPLAEILPDWRCPESQLTATEMLENIPDHQEFRILPST